MKQKFLLISLLSLFLLSACNNNVDQELIEQTADEPEKTELNQVGIPAGTIDLSLSDAAMVAQLYRNKDKATRGEINKSVKNVIPIPDKDGNPAIYAVNFEDGYLLISATKLLPPVLGEVDHGTYDPRHKGETGEEIIISELIETIEYKRATCNAEENEYRTSWYPYLESTDPRSNIKTRAMDDDEYWDALNYWYGLYDTSDSDKCKVFQFCLEGDTELLSERDRNYIYETYFYDQDPWWNTDYKWQNTAYIVVESYENNTSVGPLLGTTWNTSPPFSSYPYTTQLDPVTVAVGQIMRFFEYPSYFKWSSMPDYGSVNTQATKETQDFLQTLHNEIFCQKYEYIYDRLWKADSILTNYGYGVKKIKHNLSEVISQVSVRKKPILSKGINKQTEASHVWVVDGKRSSHYGTTYKLYFLDPDYYPNFVYREEELQLESATGGSYLSFHFNWCWGGKNNGWYIDSSRFVEYTSNRNDLIINR